MGGRIHGTPLSMAGFGLRGVVHGVGWGGVLHTRRGRAMLAGASAAPSSHSRVRWRWGMMLLASGRVAGWPVPKGSSQRSPAHVGRGSRSSAAGSRSVIRCGRWPTCRLGAALRCHLPPARRICGDDLPDALRRRRLHAPDGPAAYKVDFALSEPVPWTNPDCRRAGSLRLGGTRTEDRAAAEAEVARAGRASGRCARRTAEPRRPDTCARRPAARCGRTATRHTGRVA